MTETVNSNAGRRLHEVDMLKFIAIMGMVIVHVYEDWCYIAAECPYPTEPLDILIQFIGGPICAPLFMIACGIGVVYTRHDRPVDYLGRGLMLLVTAYLLNIFREIPANLLFGSPEEEIMLALLCIDILHLAGASFVLVGILRMLRCNRLHILVVAIAMFTFSNVIGQVEVTGITGYLLGLFVFTDAPYVCFPLTEWFIYIAIGVFLGSCLKNCDDHDDLYRKLLALGLAMFLSVTAGCLITGTNPCDFFTTHGDSYYRQGFPALLWIVGIVFTCMSAMYFLLKRFGTPEVLRFGGFFGRNLNRIYILQWLIIGNTLAGMMSAGMRLDPILAIPVGLGVLTVCCMLVPVVDRLVKHIREKGSEDGRPF